ncbi:MAG: hypothetical protein GY835_09880 [bacterium]|nr:hypothetical protein [bacterium]
MRRLALMLLIIMLSSTLTAAREGTSPGLSRDGIPTALADPVYGALFAPVADYDPAVPTLAALLGEDALNRPAAGHDIHRVLQAIAAASPRVHLETYGYSHEGRPLDLVVVTSAERLADPAALRAERRRLADPRDEDQDFASMMPVVAWIGACVHGTEPSGADGALALLHHLAADRSIATKRLLDDVVVIIDPLQNPDGRARFMSQYLTWDSRIPVVDHQSSQHRNGWPNARGNHYLLDLNRDWFALSQPETRARIRVLLDWQPQVSFDLHEMGAFDTYLFSPPRAPFNPHLPASTSGWWRVLAEDIAGAFGQYGWSCYNGDWHEEFNPNRGAAWPLMNGVVSFLGEQSSTHGRAIRRPDGHVLTYREAVHHQYTAALNLVRSAAKNRVGLLADYTANRIEGMKRGAFIIDATVRPDLVERFVRVLAAQDIEVRVAERPFGSRSARNYWGEIRGGERFLAGSCIIDLEQPQGRLARAILEFDPQLGDEFVTKERRSLESGAGSLLYESPAWSLAMAYGLDVYLADRCPDVAGSPPAESAPATGGVHPPAEYGYLLDARAPRAERALALLHAAGVKAWAAAEAFRKDERQYPVGTVLVKRADNAADLEGTIARIVRRTGVTFQGVGHALTQQGPDMGARAFRLLHAPRVALLTGTPFYQTTCGALWHYFDRELSLPCSLLRISALERSDLDLYNVLIVPDAGAGRGEGLIAQLGPEGVARIADWVRRGGTLITLGEGSWLLFGGEMPLSALRPRRLVLDQLGEYAKAQTRLNSVSRLQVDELALRTGTGDGINRPEEQSVEEMMISDDDDAFLRRFSPRGAFVRVDLNPDHWLAAGVGTRVPVLVKSDLVLMARAPVQGLGFFAPAKDLRLSGLLWPEAGERLAGSTYMGREGFGNGQFIFFAGNPTYRAYAHGTSRLLANAILLGTGMGTNYRVIN